MNEQIQNTTDPLLTKSRVSFFGVPIDNLKTNEIVNLIEWCINHRRGLHIININPHRFLVSFQDCELQKIYNSADISICDGTGILLASKLFGERIRFRIHGIDLMMQIITYASQQNHSILLVGGLNGSAAQCAEMLRYRSKFSLKIQFLDLPRFDGNKIVQIDNHSLQYIDQFQPDIIFVSLGVAKEEKWIEIHRKYFPNSIYMGVGASFDFISGRIPRAPYLIRKIGLEWFHRLIHEPRRLFKRYIFGIPHFCWIVLKQKLSTL